MENEPVSDRSMPVDLTKEFVLTKADFFASIGIWPLKCDLNPELWLQNFTQSELNHALYLLNSFMYFNDTLVHEIFAAAVRTISRLMWQPNDNPTTLAQKWEEFVHTAIVTYVTGENPNPTDSGYTFAQKARAIGITEDRIVTPEKALRILQSGSEAPIIFVDDFVGSGSQFLTTWRRQYGSAGKTFEELAPITSNEMYLCTAFCTECGLKYIQSECPRIRVNPGHLLSSNYSALAEDSIIWPSALKSTAVEFIRSASERAGIPDTGGQVDDWRGFACLGLTIARQGSIPDATLPIFYWQKNGWQPLIRKT